jgi:methyl-accepting chemotaxis protein
VEALVGISTHYGNLVHELQRERGMSAGFLGSKGTKFATELPEQRKASDATLEHLQSDLGSFERTRYAGSLGGLIDNAANALQGVGTWRTGVTALNRRPSRGHKYYTDTIALLIKVPALLPLLSHNSQIATMANCDNSRCRFVLSELAEQQNYSQN